MEHWEFFLQKVGEQDWQKLQLTQPDIPTGEYNIAINNPHRAQQFLEVELHIPATEQSPPSRHKTFAQLDEQGFAIVISQLNLQPGAWEIQCRGDILATLLGDDWEVTLWLQVTEAVSQTTPESSIEKVSDPTVIDEVEAVTQSITEETASETSLTEAMATPNQVTELRSRLSDNADHILEEIVSDLLSSEAGSSPEQPSYTINLAETNLTATRNQSIFLSGQVIAHETSPDSSLRLEVILQQPETGKVVLQLFPQVLETPFPANFSYALTVPESCSSDYLEGNLRLLGSSEQGSPVLAQQSFYLTLTPSTFQPREITQASGNSHTPVPYRPSSQNEPLKEESKPFQSGVLPPRLFPKHYYKTRRKPHLPQFPKKPPRKNETDVHDTESGDADSENHPLAQWELVREFVITSNQQQSS